MGRRTIRVAFGGRALSSAALVLALVASVLASWALYVQLSQAPNTSRTQFSDEQVSQANARLCKALGVVRRGVTLNTNRAIPGGPDDVAGALAVAANARISLYDGGQYLLARIDPATSADLAHAAAQFANTLMDIGAAATLGVTNTNPDQAARLRKADGLSATIDTLCT